MNPATQPLDAKKMADKAFNQSFAVAILCILLCAVALCSTSWAWFSASVSSSSNQIASAFCTVTTTVTDDEGEVVDAIPNTDGDYFLAADKVYTVHFLCEGTARSSYCVLTANGIRYYTEQISTSAPENTLSFTLSFHTDTTVNIHTYWGSVTQTDRALFNGGQYVEMQATPST